MTYSDSRVHSFLPFASFQNSFQLHITLIVKNDYRGRSQSYQQRLATSNHGTTLPTGTAMKKTRSISFDVFTFQLPLLNAGVFGCSLIPKEKEKYEQTECIVHNRKENNQLMSRGYRIEGLTPLRMRDKRDRLQRFQVGEKGWTTTRMAKVIVRVEGRTI